MHHSATNYISGGNVYENNNILENINKWFVENSILESTKYDDKLEWICVMKYLRKIIDVVTLTFQYACWVYIKEN